MLLFSNKIFVAFGFWKKKNISILYTAERTFHQQIFLSITKFLLKFSQAKETWKLKMGRDVYFRQFYPYYLAV